jgi:hypothetical protein
MLSKKLSLSPTFWHNSLYKPKSNLHQEPWVRNKIMFMPFHLIKTWISWIILYSLFHFHPPTRLGHVVVNPDRHVYISAWGGEFCHVSIFAKLVCQTTGGLRTGASEDRWMVALGCDEWLTTWCGLALGRVLQVQVASWFALVQVKSGRERSMPCGASEEWRDK